MRERHYHIVKKDATTGKVVSEEYRLGERLHRDPAIGPAKVEFFPNGQVSLMQFYVDGALHHSKRAASLRWTKHGYLVSETFYAHGMMHRNPFEGAAYTTHAASFENPTISKIFFVHGIPYRDPSEGPYFVTFDLFGKVSRQLFVPQQQALGTLPSRSKLKKVFPQTLPVPTAL